MAILGASQTDFENIFAGSRVFHDPRLMPRFDIQVAELTISNDNTQYDVDNSNFHSTADRHGVAVTCAATADSYNTLVDVSGGAGIMTFAYGPKPSAAATVTFKFTVDGTVYTITTYASSIGYRGVLGGSLGFYDSVFTAFNTYPEVISYNPVRLTNSSINLTVPIPALALAGLAGSYPILGWTDSFKLEVKTSTTVSASGYAKAGVFYLVL